jgi:hypothetical protein
MRTQKLLSIVSGLILLLYSGSTLYAQIGTHFPSEKKIVKDPVTGTELTFLTSKPAGDSKIYQTHNQWTADGNWVIFRSNRVKGEAMAVNEKAGTIVQVSEGGFTGMLNVARKSMKLYFMRNLPADQATPNRRGGPCHPFCRQRIGKTETGDSIPESMRNNTCRNRCRRRHGAGC